MADSGSLSAEFEQAARRYRRGADRYGWKGCLWAWIPSFGTAILVGFYQSLGFGLLAVLPSYFFWAWLLNAWIELRFLRDPRRQVERLLEQYMDELTGDVIERDHLILETVGLPGAIRSRTYLSLQTGRLLCFNLTLKLHAPTLNEAAPFRNGSVDRDRLSEVHSWLDKVELSGTKSIPSSVRDGAPFKMTVVRSGSVFECRGNLSDARSHPDAELIAASFVSRAESDLTGDAWSTPLVDVDGT